MNITAGPLDLTVTFLSPIEVRSVYHPMPYLIVRTAGRSGHAITAVFVRVARGNLERRAATRRAGVF